MALRKTLVGRFLHLAKLSSPDPQIRLPPNSSFLLQRRPVVLPAVPPDRRPFPYGDRLLDRIRGLHPDRIRLDGLSPPPAEKVKDEMVAERRGITVEEARKVLRASQIEAARARLRAIPMSCIAYWEFVQICCDASGGEQGVGIARSLDESGAVIVLGNVVFLRPELVAKAIENVIPLSLTQPSDPRRKELREMEEKKAEIDRKAVAQVRRELWSGLGFLVVQTIGFMRLTFWELSWDVMEPICFYVTSAYFMAGYFFFMRTSKDPSFEGFFESRFAAKQKRLMKLYNFDLDRFNALGRACPDAALRRIIAACPQLRSLGLRYCRDLRRIAIPASGFRLASLTIVHCPKVSELTVSAPSLRSFRFSGAYLTNYCLDNSSRLEDVYMSSGILSSELPRSNWVKAIGRLSNVKVLTLCSLSLQYITVSGANAIEAFRNFRNLRELQLLMVMMTDSNLTDIYSFFTLCQCPKLERLFIELPTNMYDPFLEKYLEVVEEKPPEVAFENLKVIKMNNFKGHHNEMELVRFLLGRAGYLESLAIVGFEEFEMDEVNYYSGLQFLRDQLPYLTKASVNAKIVMTEHDDNQLRPTHSEIYIKV